MFNGLLGIFVFLAIHAQMKFGVRTHPSEYPISSSAISEISKHVAVRNQHVSAVSLPEKREAGMSNENFVGVWTYTITYNTTYSGEETAEVYIDCSKTSEENLQCRLAGDPQGNATNYNILNSTTIEYAEDHQFKGTYVAENGIIVWHKNGTRIEHTWYKQAACSDWVIETQCTNDGEFCVNDVCKCGVFGGFSCEGNISGDYCQANTSTCMCGNTPTCLGQPTGEYCDAANGLCRCSEYVDECKYPEVCRYEGCYCGCNSSCANQPTGSFCDPINSVCKCADDVDACTDGKVCIDGACEDPTGTTTAGPTNCTDTWEYDCGQSAWACTDPRFPWLKDVCSDTCGVCGEGPPCVDVNDGYCNGLEWACSYPYSCSYPFIKLHECKKTCGSC